MTEVLASPPHDLAAEQIVLGAMMINAAIIDDVCDRLSTSAAFYEPGHQEIYAAITALAHAGGDTGPVAVATVLHGYGQLVRVGGAAYLHTLIAAVPVVVNASHYAGIVARHAIWRRVGDLRAELDQALALVDPEARAGRVDRITNELRAVLDGSTAGAEGVPWHSLLADGAAFVLDQPQGIPAVWGEDGRVLWADGESLMICGPPGAGKTTLAGQLVAARLGLLPAVLGLRVAPGAERLLYLACDRPAQLARSMARTLLPEWRDVLRQRLAVWKGPPPADFAQEPGWMLAMARKASADTVIVDSVKDVAIGISEDAVGAGYNRARQATLAAGVQVLELHHQVKRNANGGPPTALADVYGSTWLAAGAGSVVLLWGEPGDPVVRFTHLKQPAEEVGPFDVLHDHKTGLSTVHRHADLAQLAAHAPAGLTVPDAARLLFETRSPTAAQREKARRQLERLVASGRLLRAKGRPGGADGSSPDTYHAAADESGNNR